MQCPDRAHQCSRLGDDHTDQGPGLPVTDWQVVDAGQMHNHADVDECRREQVCHWNRVEGDRDTFADAIGAHELFANLPARGEDSSSHLVAQVRCEEARIQRRQRFAFGIKDVPQRDPQLLDIRRTHPLRLDLVASRIDFDNGLRPGLRSRGNNV